LIERNGEMVGLPISLLTDDERVKIINELRQQAKDHFEHADELNGFPLDKANQRAGLIITDAERATIVNELRQKGKANLEEADKLKHSVYGGSQHKKCL